MRTWLLAGALAATVLAPVPASAAAAPGTITCSGGEITALFNPAVTMSPNTHWLTLAGPTGHCSSPQYPSISSGILRGHGAFTGFCPGPFVPATMEVSVQWNDGSVSTVGGAVFQASLSGWVLLPGTITSGPFTGDRISAVALSAGLPDPPTLPCLIGGLNQLHTKVQAFAIA
ncbi:hypothetical protein HerbRD11066_37350 [Herbidospora sp. RD11066]